MLFLAASVLKNLRVDEKQMKRNLDITQGRTMSEAVMTALVRKGMNRQVGLELLETIRIYVKEHIIRLQVVFEIALITVVRDVNIPDLKNIFGNIPSGNRRIDHHPGGRILPDTYYPPER